MLENDCVRLSVPMMWGEDREGEGGITYCF